MTELEKAARGYMNIPPVKSAIKCGDIEDLESHIKIAFRNGAQWQAEQSPWISVKERLPETDNGQSLYEVIVVTGDKRFLVVINTEVEHLIGLLGVTHWMEIKDI